MRTSTELRPLSAQRNLLARADGSATFSFGSLSAYASTLGPIDPPRLRDELIDRASLQIHISPLVGVAGIASKNLGQAWSEVWGGIVLLHLVPRSVVQVNVQLGSGPVGFVPPPPPPPPTSNRGVEVSITSDSLLIGGDDDDDEEKETSAEEQQQQQVRRRNVRPAPGNPNSSFSVAQRATMMNAAMLALLDSGIAMQATVAACSCAYLPVKHATRLRQLRTKDEDAMEQDDAESSVLVLDPSPEEEYYATSTHVFAFGFAGRPPPPESNNAQSHDVEDVNPSPSSTVDEEDEEILYAESHGGVDLARYGQAVKLCRRAARDVIVPFYRRWLSEQQQQQSEPKSEGS